MINVTELSDKIIALENEYREQRQALYAIGAPDTSHCLLGVEVSCRLQELFDEYGITMDEYRSILEGAKYGNGYAC